MRLLAASASWLCAAARGDDPLPADVTVRNSGGEPLKLSWVHPNGVFYPQGILNRGMITQQLTFQEHRFRVEAAEDPQVFAEFKVRADGMVNANVVSGGVRLEGDALQQQEEVMGEGDLRLELRDAAAHAFYEQRKVAVNFINECDTTVDMFWLDGEMKRIPTGGIQKGQRQIQNTYVGHKFELSMKNGRKKVVKVRAEGDVLVDENCQISGKPLMNLPVLYRGPRWNAVTKNFSDSCAEVYRGFPEEHQHFCGPAFWYRPLLTTRFDVGNEERWRQWWASIQAESTEVTRTRPMTLQNFTQLGFNVEQIEPTLLAEVQAFHRERRLHSRPEEPAGTSIALGKGRQADTWMSFMPERLRERIFSYVQERVSVWTGIPEANLEQTSLYGIRMYHHGSVLNMHLDKEDTHALSAIFEIGRNDADDTAQWPLSIFDHDGRLHSVPSSVGQMILYESAVCGHGRRDAFPGREMANVFVHFRPRGWPAQYKADRPRLTPFHLGRLGEPSESEPRVATHPFTYDSGKVGQRSEL